MAVYVSFSGTTSRIDETSTSGPYIYKNTEDAWILVTNGSTCAAPSFDFTPPPDPPPAAEQNLFDLRPRGRILPT